MKKIGVLSENIRDFKNYIQNLHPDIKYEKLTELYVFIDINSYYADQVMGMQFSAVLFTNTRIQHIYNLILTLHRRIVT